MKKIKILGLILTLIIVIFSCEKLADPAGSRGTAVVPAISNVDPGIFDSKDLVNSYVEFKVDLASGQQADNGTVVASYNSNNERIKIADITSFPSTVRLVSGDVIQKLGISASSVKNGDVFTVEVLTTVNGVTTRSNAVLSVSVACAYSKAFAIGSYHSVSVDWATNGNITLTADLNDPYTIYVVGLEEMEGVVEDLGPLVMHIDPATYAVTVPKKAIGSSAFGYHNIAYAGSGVYNSCDGSYAMNFTISVDEGSFVINAFTFTRNP
jgi:hypothetical protein